MNKHDVKKESIKKQKETHIDVFSCGIGHAQSIEDLDFAQYHSVFASASLLKTYVNQHQNSVSIGINAHNDAKNAISFAQKGNKIAVLCSGDALYHGFGASLAKEAKIQNCSHLIKFHPNITAFQALFHKMGIAWNNVQLFSAHHGQTLPLREIISCNMPLIYAGSQYPAHLLAKEIIQFDSNQSERWGIMAEFLGAEPLDTESLDAELLGTECANIDKKERIREGKLKDLAQEIFSPTSLLLLLPREFEQGKEASIQQDNTQDNKQEKTAICNQSEQTTYNKDDYLRTQTLPLGLPEYVFAKENNLITASDARAIILSRLRLPLQGHVWDLGAGSGSVGLEAAALRPNLHVHAVEQNKDRIALIQTNKKALGIVNYTSYHANILETITELEKPQRIFIGGGGKNLPKIMDICAERLASNGIIVVSAVTLESFFTLSSWKETHQLKRTACLRIDIAYEYIIANNYHHFKNQNTLYIFTYTKD